MNSKKNILRVFIYGIFPLALLLLIISSLTPEKKVQLQTLGQVPDFMLLDSRGEEFTNQNLHGKVWVTNFIFTTCSGFCSTMTQNMLEIEEKFRNNPDVHFVSISVNPEYDSPIVLAQYAEKYKIDTSRWHFLTGARQAIEDLAVKGFKIGSVDEPVFHSSYFILVDRKGFVRRYSDGSKKENIKQLVSDVNLILKEKSQ